MTRVQVGRPPLLFLSLWWRAPVVRPEAVHCAPFSPAQGGPVSSAPWGWDSPRLDLDMTAHNTQHCGGSVQSRGDPACHARSCVVTPSTADGGLSPSLVLCEGGWLTVALLCQPGSSLTVRLLTLGVFVTAAEPSVV